MTVLLMAGGALWSSSIHPLASRVDGHDESLERRRAETNANTNHLAAIDKQLNEVETQFSAASRESYLRDYAAWQVNNMAWRLNGHGFDLPSPAPYMYGAEWNKR